MRSEVKVRCLEDIAVGFEATRRVELDEMAQWLLELRRIDSREPEALGILVDGSAPVAWVVFGKSGRCLFLRWRRWRWGRRLTLDQSCNHESDDNQANTAAEPDRKERVGRHLPLDHETLTLARAGDALQQMTTLTSATLDPVIRRSSCPA